MMNRNELSLLSLSLASAVLAVTSISAFAQNAPKPDSGAAGQEPTKVTRSDIDQSQLRQTDAQTANRAQAYYHAALAALYEEQAVNTGKPEFVQHPIDEYKYALNADAVS